MRALVVFAVLACACRTEIVPTVKKAPVQVYQRQSNECEVRDYSQSTDVPEGSKSLGLVQVPREQTDELTFEKLRAAICAKGGNALAQPRWQRASGASVADPPMALEASAWATP